MRNNLTIGSRGSKLALWQSNLVADALRSLEPELQISIQKIKTSGDKILDVPLAKIGGKGLFVKEIETALLEEKIDLAVHSMKDVPTDLPQGLIIGAVMERKDPRDALVSRGNVPFSALPKDAVIGTSSLRRKAQLLGYSLEFRFVDLRGNLDTRFRRMDEGEFDAVILASAGIERMGWAERIAERISPEICLPAVGQGAIGIEIRGDDEEVRELVSKLDHGESRARVLAERALMHVLEGGCQVPVGAYSVIEKGILKLTAAVASLDGTKLVRDSIEGSLEEAEGLGSALAKRLLAQGADKILNEIRSQHLNDNSFGA
jgi:hydroxymethylbilane synthase